MTIQELSPLRKLEAICDEIFESWDKDQRSGKLLSALSGRVHNYRQDVTNVRNELAARMAVPIDQWRIVIDEPVLIYVVHPNAQYERDEQRRKAEWEGWFVGRWIKHNAGGWMWHGMSGTVTHVAPLPARPIMLPLVAEQDSHRSLTLDPNNPSVQDEKEGV